MPTVLSPATVRALTRGLEPTHQELGRLYPGDPGERQPVHTVYGGAHLFHADTAPRLGELALRALDEHAAEPAVLGELVGLAAGDPLSAVVHARVRAKLAREPVEDFRIDFEDGYGTRPDSEEDGHAEAAAREVAAGMAAGTLPAFIGLRLKSFSAELHARAVRTLDLFLTTLLEASGGRLPSGLAITLPKVMAPAQVAAMAELCAELEAALGLAAGTLGFELMIETPQAIVAQDGAVNLPRLLAAAGGRCRAAHFGTYDYTASNNVTAAHQQMDHPACDLARLMMQVAFAGTGVRLSDGATNVMPVGPHRAAAGGVLTGEQQAENRATVHRAWRQHAGNVRRSLVLGFFQGWDLHPAQLVTRYAAVYAFFLEGVAAAGERLRNFVAKAAQATLVGDVFDDAATGQGLLNYFLRAINCGALTEAEAAERCGLTLDELRTRSFVKILARRGG